MHMDVDMGRDEKLGPFLHPSNTHTHKKHKGERPALDILSIPRATVGGLRGSRGKGAP